MHKEGPLTVLGDGPPVVREKRHPATPMALDQALYEMELVGHDFFLFIDEDVQGAGRRLPAEGLLLRRDQARRLSPPALRMAVRDAVWPWEDSPNG